LISSELFRTVGALIRSAAVEIVLLICAALAPLSKISDAPLVAAMVYAANVDAGSPILRNPRVRDVVSMVTVRAAAIFA
jgi:hypothetical protein